VRKGRREKKKRRGGKGKERGRVRMEGEELKGRGWCELGRLLAGAERGWTPLLAAARTQWMLILTSFMGNASVCVSVCPTHPAALSERRKLGSRSLHCQLREELCYQDL